MQIGNVISLTLKFVPQLSPFPHVHISLECSFAALSGQRVIIAFYRVIPYLNKLPVEL